LLEAIGFSTLVFTGGAQFAAVSVLGDGGTPAAAVAAGLLLNLRLLAFGLMLAPALRGPFWWRALASQLMIDESAAVGSAQPDRRWQRYGYVAAGLGVFVTWNATTVLGASVLGGADELIERAGIDATIPAAFLALLWPRLADGRQRVLAGVGAAIALLAAPVLPPGMPIVAAASAIVLARPWRAPAPTPADQR
jgi:predicted branched-subunit amino acid permease